ncbi:MAG: hypothetical protein K2O03_06170 [Lachnospiraceae bacterium]|nr:hypothetical protein [Lachnospiraceae bacterium]
MKNIKLSIKISIISISIMALGLIALCLGINTKMHGIMRDSILSHMGESVDMQTEIVKNYVDKAEAYLIDYAQAPALLEVLTNPTDEDAIQKLQTYTEKYARVGDNLENIYASDWNSTVLSSVVTSVIGATLRQGEALTQLQSELGKGMYNTGIMASKATGMQVISMYYPVLKEDNTPAGYVGAAIYASGLRDTLNALYEEDSEKQYLLLDAQAGTYIFCPEDDMIGTVVENADHLSILENAKNSNDRSIPFEYTSKVDGKHMISMVHYIQERGWVFVELTDRSTAYAPINQLLGIILILCLIVLAAASILIGLCVSALSKDIRKEADILQELGKLDFTKKNKLSVFCDRKDEIGMIADASRRLADAAHSVLLQLCGQSAELLRTARTISDNSHTSSNTIKDMERAVREIAESATSQAAETEKASESVLHIGDQIVNAKKKSSTLSEVASKISTSNQAAFHTLKELVDINHMAKSEIEKINQQTLSTNDSALKIKDAAELITNIADETNLLALNASIEAARAGDQGRGFAVVADQIKRLAEQSNESAHYIDDIIVALLEESSAAVKVMDGVREIMEKQNEHLTATEVCFEEVNHNIARTHEEISDLVHTIETTDTGREEVVQVVSSLNTIAMANAASTEESLASIETINSMVADVALAAEKLSQLSDAIDQNIRVFTV